MRPVVGAASGASAADCAGSRPVAVAWVRGHKSLVGGGGGAGGALQVLVGDLMVLRKLVGKGLTLVTVVLVLQLLVLVGKGLLLVDKGLHVLVLVGGHILMVVGRDLRLLIFVLVLLLMCGTL
jgi:hypothetical protein